MRLLGVRDEELGLVRIRARVGHGHNPTSIKFEGGADFVAEWLALSVFYERVGQKTRLVEVKRQDRKRGTHPDRLATFSCPCWVTRLDHETFDVAMKDAVIVGPACTECKKVLYGI